MYCFALLKIDGVHARLAEEVGGGGRRGDRGASQSDSDWRFFVHRYEAIFTPTPRLFFYLSQPRSLRGVCAA